MQSTCLYQKSDFSVKAEYLLFFNLSLLLLLLLLIDVLRDRFSLHIPDKPATHDPTPLASQVRDYGGIPSCLAKF
jgi:hypothetical protein